MMWDIINEIRRRGTMNGNDVSDYSIHALGRKKKSAGGCIARAIQYGHIRIVNTTYINGKKVNIYSVKSIVRLLEAMKGKMLRFGTDVNATQPVGKLKELSANKAALIVLGNEEHGISKQVKENCDELIIIPNTSAFGESADRPIESLNVAQAAAIVLYEMRK